MAEDKELVGAMRMSITISEKERKQIRIAAALSGEPTTGDWARKLLVRAAEAATKKVGV